MNKREAAYVLLGCMVRVRILGYVPTAGFMVVDVPTPCDYRVS